MTQTVPTASLWHPRTHPSPLVAEQYTMAGYTILRRTGEAHYELLSPGSAGAIFSGSLMEAKRLGMAMRDREVTKGFGKAVGAVKQLALDGVDVTVSDHGSIVLFRPRSPAATEWIAENVQDDAQWFGGSLAVEHRFAPYLIEGMAEAGLRFDR